MDAKTYVNALEEMGRHQYKIMEPYRVSLPSMRRGPWKIEKFKPTFDLFYMRLARDGRPPGLGQFTRLVNEHRGTVMSDTCPEVEDFLKVADRLRGHVLMTGLGLGMAIHILTRFHYDRVRTITVIEKDLDVIKMVAPHYRSSRVKIIDADAFLWLPEKGTKFDSAWHDVWDYGCDPDDHAEMRRHYRGHVVAGQQFCWGRIK